MVKPQWAVLINSNEKRSTSEQKQTTKDMKGPVETEKNSIL